MKKVVDFLSKGLVFTEKNIFSNKTIKKMAKNNWGQEISDWIPTYDPEVGDRIEFYINSELTDKKIIREKGDEDGQKTIVEFTGANDLILGGVQGLVRVEKSDRKRNFLPVGAILVGYKYHVGNYFVPFLKKLEVGVYQHGTFSSRDDHAKDEILVVYARK